MMHKSLEAEAIEEFSRQGVILVRNALNRSESDVLRDLVDAHRAGQNKFQTRKTSEAGAGMFIERFAFHTDKLFADFVSDCGLSVVAATLMNVQRVCLYCDHILIKEAGWELPTPWHRDIDAFWLSGDSICSIWIALDHTDASTGTMKFAPGSHRDGRPIPAASFDGADVLEYQHISWDLAPGDAVAFDARTVHGAFGNASSVAERRAVSLRFASEDTRWRSLGSGQFPLPVKLADGQRISDDPHFPIIN